MAWRGHERDVAGAEAFGRWQRAGVLLAAYMERWEYTPDSENRERASQQVSRAQEMHYEEHVEIH